MIKLANFLRSDKGVPTRLGFVGSRRANFFKGGRGAPGRVMQALNSPCCAGRKLGKALKTDEAASAVKASGLPTGSEEEIAAIGNALLRSGCVWPVRATGAGMRLSLTPPCAASPASSCALSGAATAAAPC